MNFAYIIVLVCIAAVRARLQAAKSRLDIRRKHLAVSEPKIPLRRTAGEYDIGKFSIPSRIILSAAPRTRTCHLLIRQLQR